MKRTLTVVALAVTFIASSAAAAGAQEAGYVPAAQASNAQTPPVQSPTLQPPTRQPQQLVNIRLELTISVTDQRGTAVAPSKTVLMHTVDRDNARIRTGRAASSTPPPANVVTSPGPVLNVDATPEILTGGRLRVSISFEYRPGGSETDKMEPIHINERLSAILEDGKPMVVSQTADPSGDRNVRVELKATILK